MKVLELFAGSCSFSNVAKELRHETFTTDIKQWGKINYVVDIFDFNINKVPFIPDIIWASPPCTTFSVASISYHWNINNTPKTDDAILGMKIVDKTIGLIEYFNPKYWYIENPRGKLRKLNIKTKSIPGYVKHVCYCKYGDKRMKPTDIWTNNFNWIPRTMCYAGNKNCHHEPAPRGSDTGTQGIHNSYENSKIPRELCLEILEDLINTLGGSNEDTV